MINNLAHYLLSVFCASEARKHPAATAPLLQWPLCRNQMLLRQEWYCCSGRFWSFLNFRNVSTSWALCVTEHAEVQNDNRSLCQKRTSG